MFGANPVVIGTIVGGLVLVPGQSSDIVKGGRLNTVLHWLAPDTESVFVAQGYPESLLNKLFIDEESEMEASFAVGLQSFPLLRLYDFFSKSRAHCLTRHKLETCVYAAKNFEPLNRSYVKSEETLLLIFQPNEAHGLALDVQRLIDQAPTTFDVCGVHVGVYPSKLTRIPDVFFCQPEPDVLLFSTSEENLETTLAQRKDPPAKAFFENWQLRCAMKRDAKIWGLRQYCRAGADRDPTNRRNPSYEILGSRENNTNSVGLALWYEENPNCMKFLFLSQSDSGKQEIEREWNRVRGKGMKSEIHERSPGLVELDVIIDDDAEGNYDLLLYSGFLLGSSWLH